MSDEPTLDAEVLAYYGQGRERTRLESVSRLEFLRTAELLERFLPQPPRSVLDVGGGAGAYALSLGRAGYDVTLIDPVPLHVEQAQGAGVESAAVGDARSLHFPDDSFDVVMLLGPLYHLPDRGARLVALLEAVRVVRPSGLIVASVISRFASTLDGLHAGFLLDDRFEAIVRTDLATGRHENPGRVPGWFTTAYFHDPGEIETEFGDAGCRVSEVLAIEGPTSGMSDLDAWLGDDERVGVLMRAIRRVEAEPSLLGCSSHLFIVAHPHA
ncbi:MAG: class I SAM-dependent methyltransferase [Microthrixaceae bacterium]